MDTAPGSRHVWLFGQLRVHSDAGLHALAGEKLQSLFAYLALHPDQMHSREKVSELLWPGAPPGRGARNLANLLYRLKAILGPGWVDAGAGSIVLRTAPDLWIDVHAFARLSAAADPAPLEQAVALYTADLLPELYDDWLTIPREQNRETYLACLYRLGEAAETSHKPRAAARYYGRLLDADPLREEAARGLMRSLGRIGRFSAALERFAQLQLMLQDELGVSPGVETSLLADHLRAEADLAAGAAARADVAPFAGRLNERARLLALLDRAQQGGGGLAVILGEGGIGKSRLLQEFANSARWRGWQIWSGRAIEYAQPAPYAPLAQALEQALPPARMALLAQTVPQFSLSVAAALVPGLAAPALLPQSLTPEQVAFGLQNVFRGLQMIGPQLFLLDDGQWADPALWPLLERLSVALHDMAILLVISARLAELQELPAAWDVIQAWDQNGVPIIFLDGLAVNELGRLAAPWHLRVDQIQHLAVTTGGNPLFALQLLQADNLEALLAQHLSLSDLATRRVAKLSPAAAHCVQVAAVCGDRVDFTTWAAVLARENVPGDQLPGLIAEIEQARALQLDRDGYRFAHDLVRAAVYFHLPEPDRRRIHHQVLAVLSTTATAQTLDLLKHARRAGALPQVAQYALQLGDQALTSFNYAAAASSFTQALDALAADELGSRYRALLGRLRANEVLGNRDAQQADLPTLLALAERLGDPQRRMEALAAQARCLWQTGDYSGAIAAGRRALTLALDSAHREMQATVLEILGQSARDQGDYQGACAWFEEALALHQQLGNQAGEAAILDLLGIVAQRQGRSAEAIALESRALLLYESSGDVHKQGHILGNLGVACWMSGDFSRALTMFEQALTLNRQIGDRRAEVANLANVGGIHGMLGDQENALSQYERALHLLDPMGAEALRAGLLANRGIAYGDLQRWALALDSLEEALALNRAMGRRRGEGYVLHALGVALLELGQPAEAQAALEASLAIRYELGERDNLTDTYCTLARFHLRQGRPEEAGLAFQAAAAHHPPDQGSPEIRRNFHFTAYQLLQAREQTAEALTHLRRAEAAIQAMGQVLPEADRARVLALKPLNREVRQALQAHSRVVTVRLAQARMPLGRRLGPTELVTVTWTASSPLDDPALPPAIRRQQILRRLLAEAAAQGAAPTDDDLADAVGVSRRTILRDIERLRQQGVEVRTRQRDSRVS